MGFLKRFFRFRRNKKPKIYVPEFASSPYVASSLHRPSAERQRYETEVDDEPIMQITQSRSRSQNDGRASYRSISPHPSLNLAVTPDTGSSSAFTNPQSNHLITPHTLSIDSLPQSRVSYQVKVHSRVRHSSTEFPFANPPIGPPKSRSTTPSSPESSLDSPVDNHPLSPGDVHRLQRLRQDPSVTSLLNVLDLTGQPRPDAFINTPIQPARSNTLRSLLGSPPAPVDPDMPEGDISWAERYLEERIGLDGLVYEEKFSSFQRQDLDKTADTFNSSCTSEANDPALSSMQVERGTLANQTLTSDTSVESVPSVGKSEALLARTPSHRASQVFKFLVDPKDRLSPTPSLSHTPSSGNDSSPNFLPSFKPLKPLPIIPLPAFQDRPVSLLRKETNDPRLPHDQRTRTSSLPLLSIDQFNRLSTDDDDDEEEEDEQHDPNTITPSKPSKRYLAHHKETKSTLHPPYLSSSNGRPPHAHHTRRRSRTLTRLDGSHSPTPDDGLVPHIPGPKSSPSGLEVPQGRDFMAEIRRRAASTVGSIVSLSKSNKRYSERFVAIEWEQ